MVVPSVDSQTMMGTRGIYTTAGGTTSYATQDICHTLGWANEYEQGSGNLTMERWDYFPFNDRDFTSVAELLLVPGCAPGLFTKQFVEFAPSFGTGTNIFNAVIPNEGPPQYVSFGTATTGATIVGAMATLPPVPIPPPNPQPAPGAPEATTPATVNVVQPYTTASTPFSFLDFSATSPVPRTHPYLNDEFFYSGFAGATSAVNSGGITLDGGGLVGGGGGDGWFKMFEFLEVPSQSVGAIGPVASGANFDWYRQDIKPGQLNLNLIMDEEVFFSLAGKQSITQSNGQTMDAMGNPVNPSDQFSQQLLNFNQLNSLPNKNYALFTSTPAAPNYMLDTTKAGYSPVPLVVTSTLLNGTPGTAVPMSSRGMAALDPVSFSFFIANSAAVPPAYGPPFYGNGLKTAWVQFLNLRHGGSGYLFGFGTGAVGQNSAVGMVLPNGTMSTVTPPQIIPPAVANTSYGTGIPAERPFHSLSYPDINYTVMRPAALPPTPYTNPAINAAISTYDMTTTPPTVISYYANDPGVRNFTQYSGYPTATYPGTLPPTLPAGVPTLTTPWGTAYEQVYPVPIPVSRLFQTPDAYGGAPVGGMMLTNMGTAAAPPPTPPPAGALILTGGASGASASGDPYVNNTNPVTPAGYTATTNLPFTSPGAVPPVVYPVTPSGAPAIANPSGNSVSLYWPVGSAATLFDGIVGDPPGIPVGTPPVRMSPPLPPGVASPSLGSADNDNRQHPYWRSEQLQRIMNLTTPRTHQYAVWITIGFFEVKRQGDLGMFVYDPTRAFDILGPEIGAANGKSTRYRSFCLVDRLRLTGFNPSSPSGFRQAVVYRQRIQ
jgi:hypothetical protein